jgi:hypothetical protein|tara:strand:+ start:1522 stop:2001 length:480 start_codon:yes stop_codon:yes gene_type:complete
MGFTTANTKTFKVYLTDKAREQLYTGKGGKLDIKYFSLHDSDIDYRKENNRIALSATTAGKCTQVPNVRGDRDWDTSRIKGCKLIQLKDFIIKDDGGLDPCPTGFVRNVNGECVTLSALSGLSKRIIKTNKKQNTSTTIASNSSNMSVGSGVGSGSGGY